MKNEYSLHIIMPEREKEIKKERERICTKNNTMKAAVVFASIASKL